MSDVPTGDSSKSDKRLLVQPQLRGLKKLWRQRRQQSQSSQAIKRSQGDEGGGSDEIFSPALGRELLETLGSNLTTRWKAAVAQLFTLMEQTNEQVDETIANLQRDLEAAQAKIDELEGNAEGARNQQPEGPPVGSSRGSPPNPKPPRSRSRSPSRRRSRSPFRRRSRSRARSRSRRRSKSPSGSPFGSPCRRRSRSRSKIPSGSPFGSPCRRRSRSRSRSRSQHGQDPSLSPHVPKVISDRSSRRDLVVDKVPFGVHPAGELSQKTLEELQAQIDVLRRNQQQEQSLKEENTRRNQQQEQSLKEENTRLKMQNEDLQSEATTRADAAKELEAQLAQQHADAAKERQEHSSALSALQAELEQERQGHSSVLSALQAELEQERQGHSSVLSALQAELEQERQGHSSALSALQAELEQERQEHSSALSALQAELEQERQEHSSALSALQAELETKNSEQEALLAQTRQTHVQNMNDWRRDSEDLQKRLNGTEVHNGELRQKLAQYENLENCATYSEAQATALMGVVINLTTNINDLAWRFSGESVPSQCVAQELRRLLQGTDGGFCVRGGDELPPYRNSALQADTPITDDDDDNFLKLLRECVDKTDIP